MKFDFIVKDVPTKFIILSGKEIEANSVFNTLEEFVSENDDINGYNLYSIDTADTLVNEGILKRFTGSRMATLYRKTEKFMPFYKQFIAEFLGND